MRTRNTKDGPGIDPVKWKKLIEQYKKKQAEKERAKKVEEKKSLADSPSKSQVTDTNPVNPPSRNRPYEQKRTKNGPNEEVLDRELKRHRATHLEYQLSHLALIKAYFCNSLSFFHIIYCTHTP